MTPGRKRTFLFCLAFFCATVLLSSYYLDVCPTPNLVSRALLVLTFSHSGRLPIDKYADETIDKSRVGKHFYSGKASIPTMLLIPVYESIKRLHLDRASETAEGLAFISKYDMSKTVFLVVTGYGLLSAWLAKSTLAYMISDYFLTRMGFSNTFFDIVLPEVRAGR